MHDREFQVRTKRESMNSIILVGGNGATPVEFYTRIPPYSSGNQEMGIRTFTNAPSYTESLHDNKFANAYGKTLESPDIVLSSTGFARKYPGSSGQSLTKAPRESWNIQDGFWLPYLATTVNHTLGLKTAVADDIRCISYSYPLALTASLILSDL